MSRRPPANLDHFMEELLLEQFAGYGHNEWTGPTPHPIDLTVDEQNDGPDAEIIELRPRRIA